MSVIDIFAQYNTIKSASAGGASSRKRELCTRATDGGWRAPGHRCEVSNIPLATAHLLALHMREHAAPARGTHGYPPAPRPPLQKIVLALGDPTRAPPVAPTQAQPPSLVQAEGIALDALLLLSDGTRLRRRGGGEFRCAFFGRGFPWRQALGGHVRSHSPYL